MYNVVIRFLCTALVLSLAACGGGGGGGSTTPPPANNVPVITEGASASVNMSVNSTPTAFSLTLHASDADNDTLTWSISTPAGSGNASVSGTGTSMAVAYTPNTDYVGADSFAVQVSDGKGGTASITVNVTVGNAAPVITQGASVPVVMSENSSPTAFSVAIDATDANGDTLSWSLGTTVTAQHGTATASGTGASPTVNYTPTLGYVGTDSFDVQVSDGHGGTDTITVNVTMTNNAPVITQGLSIPVSMSENGVPTAFSLTLNATDANGDTLAWSISSQATNGTAAATGTGTSKAISYTPNLNYLGTDSFVVKVADGNNGNDTIIVNVTITNDAIPVIAEGASVNTSMSVNGTPSGFSLSLNASDANGDTLTWSISSQATNGNASVSGTGTTKAISYVPNTDYAGADAFVVKVDDGNGGVATTTVNVAVNNDASPIISDAKPASVSMSVNGAPNAFSLTLHASDANGEVLTWSILTQGTKGVATASGTGTSKVIGYTPNKDYAGADSFVVQVSDGNGGTDTITVNVTINDDATPAITEQPGPLAATISVNSTPTAFSLTLHGSDANNETLTWSISKAAGQGTAGVDATGTTVAVSYTPNPDVVGTDTFDVQVSDANGLTDTITVNVDIVNDAPVISQGTSTSIDMSENSTPTAFSVSLDATDNNNDTLTWSLGTGLTAQHASSVSVTGTGASPTVTYTPATDYTGTDSFDVQVDDGHGGTDTITLNLTIWTTNQVPISVDDGVNPTTYYTYNRPFVSVTICEPATPTNCQTIDKIVVDTGSTGLRVLASAFNGASPANYTVLPPYTGTGSDPIAECHPFVSGYMWGALKTAKVQVGGEVTSTIPIQVVNDTSVASVPTGCSNVGADLGSVSVIKANGIIGMGYFKHDCGPNCTSAGTNNVYYTCTTLGDPTSCGTIGIAEVDQVPNPVGKFGTNGGGASDNNGVTISLNPVTSPDGDTSVTGTLTFGVNTQPYNTLGSVQKFQVTSAGFLPTDFNGVLLCNSAIDSGSNNLNFPQGTIAGGNTKDTPPLCADGTFYCPATGTLDPFTATIKDKSLTTSAMVSFDVTNTEALSASFHAFNDIAAKFNTTFTGTDTTCTNAGGTAGGFIWGLPFFFGRDITYVIEGNTVDTTLGPYIAF